jgi:hypothetical protein
MLREQSRGAARRPGRKELGVQYPLLFRSSVSITENYQLKTLVIRLSRISITQCFKALLRVANNTEDLWSPCIPTKGQRFQKRRTSRGAVFFALRRWPFYKKKATPATIAGRLLNADWLITARTKDKSEAPSKERAHSRLYLLEHLPMSPKCTLIRSWPERKVTSDKSLMVAAEAQEEE